MPADAARPEARKIAARLVDRPELGETFADAVGALSFDGNTLRVEFLVTRLGAAAADGTAQMNAVPVCRLVLTPRATNDLMNRLRGLGAEVQKQAAAGKAGAP